MKNFHWKMMGRLGNNLFQWAYLYSQVRQGKLPDIYLQSPEYFEPYGQEIKSLLQEGIGITNKVAIHVRRGDYVNNPFYVDLMKTDYYERAMKEFPDDKFIVVSDNIEWCKQQPIFKNCEFSENTSEEDDINLIASCIGQIISNSSFSWWGAFLSPHGGLVIAPKKWYSDGVERTKVPSTWKRI